VPKTSVDFVRPEPEEALPKQMVPISTPFGTEDNYDVQKTFSGMRTHTDGVTMRPTSGDTGDGGRKTWRHNKSGRGAHSDDPQLLHFPKGEPLGHEGREFKNLSSGKRRYQVPSYTSSYNILAWPEES
jgi:hypothetical protein